MKHQKSFLESAEGIGEVLADRIVEHFGDELEDILRLNPERLEEVRDIGPERREEIMELVYWRFQVMSLMKNNFEPMEYLGNGYRVFVANPDAEKEESVMHWQDLVIKHEVDEFKRRIHQANQETERWRKVRYAKIMTLTAQMEEIFEDKEEDFHERQAQIQELKDELKLIGLDGYFGMRGRAYEEATDKALHRYFIERDIDEYSPEMMGWEFLSPAFDDWFNQTVGPERVHTKTVHSPWYDEDDRFEVKQWPQAELPEYNYEHFRHLKDKQRDIFELLVFSVKTALINMDGKALYELNQKFRQLWHTRLDGCSNARAIRSEYYPQLQEVFEKAWKYYKKQRKQAE